MNCQIRVGLTVLTIANRRQLALHDSLLPVFADLYSAKVKGICRSFEEDAQQTPKTSQNEIAQYQSQK